MRTAQQIEADASLTAKGKSEKKHAPGRNPNSLKNLKPFQPGQSGNPGGRRKDLSREISRQVFENNPDLAYQAAVRQAFHTPYGYQVHAERAYGKLVEKREVTGANGGPLEMLEVTDGNLREQIAELERELGFAREIATTATLEGIEAGTGKANGKAEDHVVLPGNGSAKA